MSIHVMCPSFPTLEMQGTFTFDSITFDEACDILSCGQWGGRSGETCTIAKNPGEPLQRLFWRFTWAGPKHLLNRSGFAISDQMDRRGEGAGGSQDRMEPGDVGVIFRSARKDVDLKSRTLRPGDFFCIKVTRER